ncbi:hypothetical protein HDV57DRAFT_502197 [Trichoderma longibrachiatum]
MLLLLLLLLLLYCFCCYWAAVPYTALPTLPSVDLPEELASRRFAGQYLCSYIGSTPEIIAIGYCNVQSTIRARSPPWLDQ